MTSRMVPQCLTCVHYQDDEPQPRCAVFPAGIPWPIWDNDADHRQPYKGDDGRRWAPAWPGAQFPGWSFHE
jgi:hypothetical protein